MRGTTILNLVPAKMTKFSKNTRSTTCATHLTGVFAGSPGRRVSQPSRTRRQVRAQQSASAEPRSHSAAGHGQTAATAASISAITAVAGAVEGGSALILDFAFPDRASVLDILLEAATEVYTRRRRWYSAADYRWRRVVGVSTAAPTAAAAAAAAAAPCALLLPLPPPSPRLLLASGLQAQTATLFDVRCWSRTSTVRRDDADYDTEVKVVLI